MRIKEITLGVVFIILIGGFILATVNFYNNYPTKDGAHNELNLKSILIGDTGTGDVSIELIPIEFNDGKLNVAISANTHSVDLSQFNLKEITTLEYNGKIIKPMDASKLSGHHSDGNLIFNLGDEVKNFIIKIEGIPLIDERIFKWSD